MRLRGGGWENKEREPYSSSGLGSSRAHGSELWPPGKEATG